MSYHPFHGLKICDYEMRIVGVISRLHNLLFYSAKGLTRFMPIGTIVAGVISALAMKAAEKITDRLIELLQDKNIRARVTAMRALGKVGDARALGALRAAQQRECLDQLKAALLDAIAALEKKA